MKRLKESAVVGILTVLCCLHGFAQKGIQAMFLEVSANKTTNLIYPFPIISVDIGSPDMLAQKARNVENVLQLKAGFPDFEETNLTVITADGRLYSYLLIYKEDPTVLNVDYKGKDATGAVTELSDGLNQSVLASTSSEIAIKEPVVTGVDDQSFGIHLSLEGVYIRQDILYFQLKTRNLSDIPFDTDQFRFFIRDNKQSKRTATQELELKPVYVFGDPSKIPTGSSVSLVYALPKFTISDKKHLVIQLFEKNRGRNLELKIRNGKLIKSVSSLH